MTRHYDTLFTRSTMPMNTLASDFLPSTSFRVPFAINNLLPVGLTLLSGNPRSGKTSLALHLALDIAANMPALNSYVASLPDNQQPYRVSQGRVSYLALSNSHLTLQQMSERLFSPRPDTIDTPDFHLCNTTRPLTPEEGLQDLYTTITSTPDARLLVIDNLASCRKIFPGSERDLLDLLRRLAEACQISILILHTCKRSSPLVAHVDHHLHLSRLPITGYYRLEAVSRHFKPATHLLYCPPDAINFRFTTLAEATALHTLSARKVLSPERLAILHLLHASSQDLTPLQITATLALDYDCIRQVLSKMVKANLLTTTQRAHYAIHPFIRPLLPALLDHCPLIPQFSLSDLPPDDFLDPTPSETAIAHNSLTISLTESEITSNPLPYPSPAPYVGAYEVALPPNKPLPTTHHPPNLNGG